MTFDATFILTFSQPKEKPPKEVVKNSSNDDGDGDGNVNVISQCKFVLLLSLRYHFKHFNVVRVWSFLKNGTGRNSP